MRKTDLRRELLRTVPRPQLVAAIALVLEQRHRRATGDAGAVEFDVNAEAFVASATVRQLRLLREIALDLDLQCLGPVN